MSIYELLIECLLLRRSMTWETLSSHCPTEWHVQRALDEARFYGVSITGLPSDNLTIRWKTHAIPSEKQAIP